MARTTSGWKRHQFCGMGTKTFGVTVAPAVVDLQSLDQPVQPTSCKPLHQTPQCELCMLGRPSAPGFEEYADAPDAFLRRARSKRPRRRRSAEQRDELAPFHSITSSASDWTELGTSMPSARAVCRLMTKSNLVDCKTGSSAAFAPFSEFVRSAPRPAGTCPRCRCRSSSVRPLRRGLPIAAWEPSEWSARRQRCELDAAAVEKSVGGDKQGVGRLSHEG